jgi:hypothetical protein
MGSVVLRHTAVSGPLQRGLQELTQRDRNTGSSGALGGMGGGGYNSAAPGPPRSIVYGATDITTGAEFIAQLSLLGKKTGH